MSHYARTGGHKPALDVLPSDPATAFRQACARNNASGRKTSIAAKEHVAQAKALLADGPCTVAEIQVALKITADQAKWAVRKMRIAGEVEPCGDARWRLVTP